MQFRFENPLFYWRGPAPFYFIRVPETQSKKIKLIANQITYGWGVIPASCRIGKTEFSTALFPKDGLYLIPVKNAVRFGENLEVDQLVKVTLRVGEGS